MVPCDFTADSEEDALGQAEAFIAESRHFARERALEAAGGDEDMANRETGYFAE